MFKKTSFWICILILLILFLFYSYFYPIRIEHFQDVVPKTNAIGDLNDPRVALLYQPQNSIFTSNSNKYWKEIPNGYNTDFPQELPPPIQEYNLALPKEAQHGTNSYRKGLLDYNRLLDEIQTKEPPLSSFGTFEEKLINPTTKESLEYKYQLDFEYHQLNKHTWRDRYDEYIPNVKTHFSYSQIKSPIDNINKINNQFLDRLYDKQQTVLNDAQLVMFGIVPFEMFKYAIQKIEYNEEDLPLYTLKVVLYRDSDLYLTTISYKGLIKDGVVYIYQPEYIGGSPSGNYLMNTPFEKEPTYDIINKNYTNNQNGKILALNPDNVVKIVKDKQESYKINNQFACFNTDPDIYTNPKKSGEILVTFNHSDRNNTVMTKGLCESYYDWYGRLKPIGVLDTPCKKDTDCPYYQSNKNYKNERGKCNTETGQCELPVNMKPLGFRYFSPVNKYKPVCYNCKSDKWNISTPLEECCDEQFDKEKYPFLDGPDYAYENDYKDRYNHYLQKNCYMNSKKEIICK